MAKPKKSFLEGLGITAMPKWVHGANLCTVTVEVTEASTGNRQFQFTLTNENGARMFAWTGITEKSVSIASSRLAPLIGLQADEKLSYEDIVKISEADLSTLSGTIRVFTEARNDGERTRTIFRRWAHPDAETPAVEAAKAANATAESSAVPY